MTFQTEDQLLSATDTDDTDKKMQRALKIRKAIRVLAADAIRRDNDECTSAMQELYLLIGVALLALHELKPYEFMASEIVAQPEDPPEDADMFSLLPVVDNQPGERDIEYILGFCDKALTSWRTEVPPAAVN